MCVTDRHDITLPVKVALYPNATNQAILLYVFLANVYYRWEKKVKSRLAPLLDKTRHYYLIFVVLTLFYNEMLLLLYTTQNLLRITFF